MNDAEPRNAPQKSDDIMRQYPRMLELAGQMKCNLQPARDDFTILRGLCPFHQASRMHDSRTLRIDAKTGRFKCDYCAKSGSPLAFAAITWGVNARDAHILLEHYQGVPITPERPPYPPNMPELAGAGERRQWLNSALMSRAADYYHELLYSSYPPLRTLAKLGISPEKAEKAGVGYCAGAGFKEHLLENTDIAEDETEGSPLWTETGAEALAGRITITDRDHTGGALWITSIAPETDAQGYNWRNDFPYNTGLRGAKPIAIGQYSVTARTGWACVTDDIRLYIAAAAAELPAIFLTQIRRPESDIADRCRRIAAALLRRSPKSLTLCIHDLQAAAIIKSMIEQSQKAPPVLIHRRESFMKQLKPDTRNLGELKREQPVNPKRAKSGEQSAESAGNEEAAAESPARNEAPAPQEPEAESGPDA